MALTPVELRYASTRLSRIRDAPIGVTERDVTARLGQPTNTILSDKDKLRYWAVISERPVEGKMLLYAYSLAVSDDDFQEVYLDKNGRVQCSLVHNGR